MRYLFVLLVLAGCAATNWTKDGATPAELDRDYKECKQEAIKGGHAGAVFGALGAASSIRESDEKIRACMRQKGWRAQN